MKDHLPPEPIVVEVNGKTWHRYTCSFKSQDGKYCFDIYALNDYHAELLMSDLRDSARVDGRLAGISGSDDDEPNDT